MEGSEVMGKQRRLLAGKLKEDVVVDGGDNRFGIERDDHPYDSHTQRLRLLLDCVRHDKNEVTDLQVKAEQSLIIWKGGKGNTKASKASPVIVSLISEDTDIVLKGV